LLASPKRTLAADGPGRRARLIARLPWIAFGLSIALTALGLWLLYLSYDTPVGPRWGPRGFATPIAVTFSSVGALIASRRPRNSIGWLFVSIGFLAGIQNFVEEYAVYAVLTVPGSLPGGTLAAWIFAWVWVPGTLSTLSLLPLLFPTGQLISRGWRPVAWLALAFMGLFAAVTALTPGPLENFAHLDNPLGIRALSPLRGTGVTNILPSILLMIAISGLCWASLAVRYRRSVGNERAQLKWFLFAVSLTVVVAPLGMLAVGGIWGPLLFIGAILGIPISVGVAILRHRLYTIDLIVNRTLVYGALTGVLATTYFATVAILQAVFRAVAGQDSPLAVVVSTLAIAALFSPLRRRFQAFIDHRFYRRKYDAERTLASFGTTARDEVELERLAETLVGVIRETMQPSAISLWIRESQ